MLFADRTDAGKQLAEQLARLRLDAPVVLGLPRGGIPVAYEAARALAAPLDVITVRKLGVPVRPELGFGAIGEDGVLILNDEVVRAARLGPRDCAAVEQAERTALRASLRRYRGERPPAGLAGRTAVIVDDGVATGSTASAACRVARARGAARVVLAVPVASPRALEWLRGEADDVVCLYAPAGFGSVGQWYADFAQTTDGEVAGLLASGASAGSSTDRAAEEHRPVESDVVVRAGRTRLPGNLNLPEGARGVVVFAHGSGSSRHSPRNRAVATALNRAGLGTLLFDLLTPEEARDRANVFDIPLLARRLTLATGWLRDELAGPVCYFGASTGAAAALTSAAEPDADIAAVVSRGGRPDLAADRLTAVRAPTLLVVGGADAQVLHLNEQAAGLMRCEHQVAVVPGATHLFEEPGALEAVADLSQDWFTRHLSPAARSVR
ncbi:phosphoribosyltransferase family protein [Streptomyces sp. NPDC058405]|uniref:phosphoribosyltransferase family protein n=1 Tax=Streptomyces sp. NPDC058405 TaxID=3346482 RepID=UPI003649E09C